MLWNTAFCSQYTLKFSEITSTQIRYKLMYTLQLLSELTNLWVIFALKLCCEETSTRIFEHYHEHHIIIFVVRIKKTAYPDAQVRTISEPQDFFGRSENDCTIAVPNCGSRRRPWPCPFGAYIFEPSPNINTHSL